MVQLSLAHFRVELPPATITAMRAEFTEFHTFHLRSFLDTSFLAFLHAHIHAEDFKPRSHGDLGNELAVDSRTNIGVHSLQLRMNDAKVAAFFQEATGVSPVKHFEGRVYRMRPGGEQHDRWHSDVCEGRKIGVSINLSPVPYRGGTFTIRQRADGTVIRAMPNLGPGDAIAFRIDPALQHMVSQVEGSESKTAFAGWFHEADELADYLHHRAASRP